MISVLELLLVSFTILGILLVDLWVLGLQWDSKVLDVFSYINDSMFQWQGRVVTLISMYENWLWRLQEVFKVTEFSHSSSWDWTPIFLKSNSEPINKASSPDSSGEGRFVCLLKGWVPVTAEWNILAEQIDILVFSMASKFFCVSTWI